VGAEPLPSDPASGARPAGPGLPARRQGKGDTGRSCRCGHGKRAHEHYRAGSDCALCDCAKFRRPFLQRLRRH
jgi:hypothetical protein